MALLDFVGLGDVAHGRSGDLPFGWQRLLEIARRLGGRASPAAPGRTGRRAECGRNP